MNHSIDYFNKQQQKLYEYMVNLTQNVTGVEKIVSLIEQLKLSDLVRCLYAFSQEIKIVGEKLHTQISSGDEPDILVCLYQQVSNYLLRLSRNWELTSQRIKSEITEPYTQFVLNFRSTNRNLNAESKKQVNEIWETRKEMCKTQDEYWKIMKQFEQKSQQTQEMVDLIEKGSATRDDLQKQFTSSLKLQELAVESEKDYKNLLAITNEKWKSFHEEWDKIFANVGLNEQSRIMFTKQTVSSLLNLLPLDEYSSQIEEKITDMEVKLKEDPKVPIRKLIEKKMENKDTFKFQFEEFISYDQWKKISINQEQNNTLQQIHHQWQIVGDRILEDEKKIVDKYLATLFTIDISDKSELLIKVKQILQKQAGRNYFNSQLSYLHSKSIEEKQTSFYLALSNEQFQELNQLIRFWLNYIELNDLYESEDIYDLLLKSIRIVRKDGRDRVNLASQLSDITLWRKIEKWIELFQYINARKVDEKRKQVELLNQQNQNNIVQKGFKMIGSIFKNLGPTQQSQNELNESEISYMIMEEINLFLTSLKLPSDLSTEIIIQIAFQQPSFDKEHIKKLLEKQEDLHNTLWKKMFKSGKSMLTYKSEKYDRRKMDEYENKVVQVFGATMKYLTLEDNPWQLLLINSQFSLHLRHKIKKFYLANGQIFSSEQTHQLRLKLIGQALKLRSMKIDYVEMKTKVGLEMDINQLHEETIKLDVQRSLHLHKEKINSSVLQSLLRIYAFYNQEVGYCQGMNYIAGYIYLTFQDQVTAYKAFDRMMNLYFKDLYINDFSKLKIGFYQFDRLLQVFLPELSQHLKDQKIDPSYYVASWFITLYSNVFQFSQRSALLNIIWDIFLAEEWKGFFKVTFYLLWLLQQEILDLEFDDILHYLGQLIRSEFFTIDNEKELIKLIQNYDKTVKENESIKTTILQKFRVTNRMLRSLDSEYHSFQMKLNKKLNLCLKK